ncbi:MAG: hypothetical protein NVSMB52_01750 [Chloroflexota bacterium]
MSALTNHTEEERSDTTLMQLIAAEDPEALRELMDRYGRRMLVSAVKLLGPRFSQADAEDVSSEAFFKVWQHADSYDPQRGSATAWIGRIVYYTSVDYRRKWLKKLQSQEPFLEERHHQEQDDEIQTVINRLDSSAEIQAAMAKLQLVAPLDAEIVRRGRILGQGTKQIGKEMSMHPSAVRVRTHRALKRLHTLLVEERKIRVSTTAKNTEGYENE